MVPSPIMEHGSVALWCHHGRVVHGGRIWHQPDLCTLPPGPRLSTERTARVVSLIECCSVVLTCLAFRAAVRYVLCTRAVWTAPSTCGFSSRLQKTLHTSMVPQPPWILPIRVLTTIDSIIGWSTILASGLMILVNISSLFTTSALDALNMSFDSPVFSQYVRNR